MSVKGQILYPTPEALVSIMSWQTFSSIPSRSFVAFQTCGRIESIRDVVEQGKSVGSSEVYSMSLPGSTISVPLDKSHHCEMVNICLWMCCFVTVVVIAGNPFTLYQRCFLYGGCNAITQLIHDRCFFLTWSPFSLFFPPEVILVLHTVWFYISPFVCLFLCAHTSLSLCPLLPLCSGVSDDASASLGPSFACFALWERGKKKRQSR